MKKVLCLIAVLALAAPLFAAEVTVNVTDDGNAKVKIGYDASAVAEADRPVGIALKVVVTKGRIKALDSYDNTELPVYIDYAYTAETGTPGSYAIGAGQPLAASETVPGALDLGSLPVTMVVVCMGRLQTGVPGPNPGPAIVANLVTLELEQNPADPCNYAYVTVSAEAVRGGIVGAGAAFTTNLPVGPVAVQIVAPPAGPACWMDAVLGTRQCNGDYAGAAPGDNLPDGNVNSTDFLTLKASYGKSYPDAAYNPCADANRNGSVDSTDFLALKAYYGLSVPGTCTPGGVWPPL